MIRRHLQVSKEFLAKDKKMKIGIISDIHADQEALIGALQLLEEQQVDTILCAGDSVEKGPDGDLVVQTLQEYLIPSVMGNHDFNAIQHHKKQLAEEQTLIPHKGHEGNAYLESLHPIDHEPPLQPETIEQLTTLPMTRTYLWEGLWLMVAHATPEKFDEKLFLFSPPKKFKRVAQKAHVDILILGHTHEPMRGCFLGTHFFNPGSVCKRRPRDSHTCAILELPTLEYKVFDIALQKEISIPFLS